MQLSSKVSSTSLVFTLFAVLILIVFCVVNDYSREMSRHSADTNSSLADMKSELRWQTFKSLMEIPFSKRPEKTLWCDVCQTSNSNVLLSWVKIANGPGERDDLHIYSLSKTRGCAKTRFTEADYIAWSNNIAVLGEENCPNTNTAVFHVSADGVSENLTVFFDDAGTCEKIVHSKSTICEFPSICFTDLEFTDAEIANLTGHANTKKGGMAGTTKKHEMSDRK